MTLMAEKMCIVCGRTFSVGKDGFLKVGERPGGSKTCSGECSKRRRRSIVRNSLRRLRKRDPDYNSRACSRYYWSNPEAMRSYARHRRKSNPPNRHSENQRRRKWRKNNPEKARAEINRWRSKHRLRYNSRMRIVNYKRRCPDLKTQSLLQFLSFTQNPKPNENTNPSPNQNHS